MKNWFAEWFDSPYYHILYKNRSHEEATHFIELCIRHFEWTANKRVLDIACGKGRHAKVFADAGFDVTGIDLSPQSIEAANQYSHQHLHFYVHDMRKIFCVNYFDIVTNLFTSFAYFQTNHENYLAARAMAANIKKGGVLIVDFVNQAFARQNIIANPHEIITDGNIQFTISRSYTNHQLIKQIDIQDGNQSFSFTEKVNSFDVDTFKHFFEKAGLSCTQIFGNYDLSTYNASTSPRMILLFNKF